MGGYQEQCALWENELRIIFSLEPVQPSDGSHAITDFRLLGAVPLPRAQVFPVFRDCEGSASKCLRPISDDQVRLISERLDARSDFSLATEVIALLEFWDPLQF